MRQKIGLIGLIGLVWFAQPVLANELSDLKKDVTGLKGRVQELEIADRVMGGPTLNLNGFTDISFTSEDGEDKNTNNFAMGQFDLFMTSRISDNVSFLGEIIFEFDEDTNETLLDLERVELKYTLTEWLTINVGRMHTSLGYWNTAYHHSTWLHTSIFRPLLSNWEDDNGIMPSHIVGVEFSGRKEVGLFALKYALGVGNGRGKNREEIQNVRDANDAKAINFLIGISPDFVPGLEFGVNVYTDDIPADTTEDTNGNPVNPARNGKIDELILGGYVAYLYNNLELLGEVSNINHDDSVKQKEYDTLAFYIQGGYQIEDFTPYYRFDYIDFGGGDPYYAAPNQNNIMQNEFDITKHSVGLRWDVNTWHALKLEYSLSDKDQAGGNTHAVSVSASFRF